MPTKRAHTIPAPAWWVDEVGERVQTGRGRRRADDERMPQVDLAAAIRKKYGERGAYHPSEISRCVLGSVAPLDLALQISDVLGLPPPCVLPTTARQAAAVALAVLAPDIVLGTAHRIVAAAQAEPQAATHTAGVMPQADDARSSTDGGSLAPAGRAERVERATRIIMQRVKVGPKAGASAHRDQTGHVISEQDEGAVSSRSRRGGAKQHQGARPVRHRR